MHSLRSPHVDSESAGVSRRARMRDRPHAVVNRIICMEVVLSFCRLNRR